MTDAPVGSRLTKKKIFFGLSAVSVAIAAVIAAVGILSGGETWKAVATAGLIFALNILVLISFTAAHTWLKIIQRTASVIAVLGSLYFTWRELPYNWSYGSEDAVDPHPFLSWLRDWTSATWILVAFFSALSLLSICWKHIRESVALRVVYFIAMALGIGSASVFWISAGSSDYYSDNTSLTLLGSALSVLGAAASLIVIIGAFVEKGRRKSEHTADVVRTTEHSQSVVPIPPSDLRGELRAMAESGELAELILAHPATLANLRFAILDTPDEQSEPLRED